MTTAIPTLEPGQRVRLTQQLRRRGGAWAAVVEGEVVAVEQKKTGSWFAHAKHDRLWLDRVLLRKDDGELAYYNLDQYSRVELLSAPPPHHPPPPPPPPPHPGAPHHSRPPRFS